MEVDVEDEEPHEGGGDGKAQQLGDGLIGGLWRGWGGGVCWDVGGVPSGLPAFLPFVSMDQRAQDKTAGEAACVCLFWTNAQDKTAAAAGGVCVCKCARVFCRTLRMSRRSTCTMVFWMMGRICHSKKKT